MITGSVTASSSTARGQNGFADIKLKSGRRQQKYQQRTKKPERNIEQCGKPGEESVEIQELEENLTGSIRTSVAPSHQPKL